MRLKICTNQRRTIVRLYGAGVKNFWRNIRMQKIIISCLALLLSLSILLADDYFVVTEMFSATD